MDQIGSAPVSLDPTMGAFYIGVLLSSSLYGVSCLQAFAYYRGRSYRDLLYLRFLVAAVWCLDTTHQVFVSQAVYRYLVSNYFDAEHLTRVLWTVVMEVLVTALIALLVQGFYVAEVYRMSRKNIVLTGCAGLSVLGQLVVSAYFSGKAVQYEFYTGLYETKDVFIGVLAAFSGVSIAMTIIYWYFLQSQDRSQYRPHTKKAANRTLALCLDSGVLTTLFAIASLIAFVVHPKTFEYTPFLFCLGRLYTLSFLSMLNGTMPTNPKPTTSSSFGNGVYLDGVGPRGNVHVMSPLTPTRAQNVSIHIDTVQYVDRDESDQMSTGYLDAKSPSDYESKERSGMSV